MAERQTGTVAKVVGNKGFGFVKPDGADAGPDLFFHASAVSPREAFDTLTTTSRVSFVIQAETPDGRPRAVEIVKAGEI